MSARELQQLFEVWEREAQGTLKVLRALPPTQYDFRPDPEGRSLGELAWHLAEIEGYMTNGVERGAFVPGERPPGIERPKTIEALAPGYERVHAEAVGRVSKLGPDDLARSIPFIGGRSLTISAILWNAVLHHLIHHRGQLTLMCRLAAGAPPGLYGPSREETAKIREAAKAKG